MTPNFFDAGPGFLFVGKPKSGPGWVVGQLGAHPDFWMPPSKELHYLGQSTPKMENSTRLYRRYQQKPGKLEQRSWDPLDARDIGFLELASNVSGKEMSFERYRSLFRSKGDLLSGDITPGYSALPGEKISAIGNALPSARVI